MPNINAMQTYFKKAKQYADGGCYVTTRILFLVFKYLIPKFQ